jgi:hypothetical protein
MNLMTRPNQTRHQLLPDRSRRSCDKHSHHQLLHRGFYLHPTRQDDSPGCDTSEHPGEVLERLRSEEIDTDASSNELQIRRDALTRRLAAKNTEKDRYVRAYAQGHISEEELAEYVADIKNQTNNLRLLISSVEDDLARLTETREVAESAAKWLLTLRERASEVEDNTPEAFQKRRELVRLLVEKITTDRDEDGHPRVEITYRFGSPPEESFVPSVLNSGPREAE